MEENKRGGKRLGAGRKPLANKKKLIPLYIEENKIWPFGSEEKMKEKLYDFVSDFKDLTKPTNEIKPFTQPKTNYQVNVEPKPEMIPMGSFEVLKAKILKTETVKQIEAVMKEIKVALMPNKQKQALETIAKEHSVQFYAD